MALGFYPVYRQKIGGTHPDYDFQGQVPFAGMYHTLVVDNALVARVDTRFDLKSNQFLTLKLNYARAASQDYLFTDKVTTPSGQVYYLNGLNYFGTALEYAVNTRVGPFTVEVGWNNVTEKFGAAFSIGKFF